jgi:hypothetical protein
MLHREAVKHEGHEGGIDLGIWELRDSGIPKFFNP